MKGSSRAAVRSIGKLVEQSRQCFSPISVPGVPPRECVAPSPTTALGKGVVERRWLRDQARSMPPWGGRRLQLERGFLGIGDGDEELGLSKHFEQNRVFGYTPEQVFEVVAAVDLYEDFVPWCQKSKVVFRTDDKMDAELEIGFKLFVERYLSHVQMKPPTLIKTTVSQSSLFDFLNNEWHFKPGPTPDTCHLFFVVDFRFKSPLYRRAANLFFNEVQAQLVGSFEERCQAVYGPSMETIMR